jgi:hypothetical protein
LLIFSATCMAPALIALVQQDAEFVAPQAPQPVARARATLRDLIGDDP